jgi:NADPH-dependent curcumin reductase CurA
MSTKTSKSWIVANKASDLPTFDVGDTQNSTSTFKLVSRDLPPVNDNEVLVKTLFLSNDPAQRLSIAEHTRADRHYSAPVEVGEPMQAYGLGEVLESKSDAVPVGSIVQGSVNWNEFNVLKAENCIVAQPLPNGLSLSHYLGAFGGTGLTAYYGLTVIGEAKQGQRVVISGAAGATGSMAVQIAKKVIWQTKIRWLER